MKVEVDHLETLWPPYRGHVLLRVAGESHGRVINSKIAVVAGHAALSLEVRKRPKYKHQRNETTTKDGARSSITAPRLSHISTCLRLTVLLDAIPDDGPKPNSHQMEKFLMRVVGSLELSDVEGRPPASKHRGLLGEDIPEILVVENTAKVISSSFLTLDGAGTFAPQSAQGLVYACIEANGLLRLWKWGAEASGWCWTYLNRCNLCACREDPSGSLVLTAALSPEPEATRRDGYSRHRIVWEQEDDGEGAGLGLDLTSAGPQPPRSVWCRRITFEAINGGNGYAPPGAYENSAPTWSAGMEISVGFSVRLSSTGCDTLLSSRQGAWIIEGERVTFNHFQTGRLSEVILTRPVVGERDDGAHSRDPGNEESSGAASTDSESDPDGDSFTDHDDHDDPDDDGMETVVDSAESDFGDRRGNAESNSSPEEEQDAKIPLPRPQEPSYAVHDTTGDLMMYEPLSGVIRVIGLPGGGGSLTTRMQCTLEPTPSEALCAFAVRLNQAVLLGEELCSVYDLCTGRLLGSTAVKWCPANSGRRRVTGGRRSRNLPYTRGKRRHYAIKSRSSTLDCVDNHPVLWVSGTRGHIMGMLWATKVLRIRPPRPESCAQAFLAPMSNGSPAPAPRILQYVKEYHRLVGTRGTSQPSLLPDLLGALSRRGASGQQQEDPGGSVRMMELLRHAFPADKQQKATSVPGSSNGPPVPPWLLLAMLPAAQQDALRVAHARRGDPSVGAAELQLRRAIEGQIATSLGSLDRIRELLQDPAGSARQVSRAGVVADDGVAEELDEIAAGVDPATVLFEHTLRSWMACRRGDGGKKKRAGNGDLVATHSEEGKVSSSQDMGALVGAAYEARDSLGPMSNDGLELAFECEVAGEDEATDIPFLKLLLDGSSEGGEALSSGAAAKKGKESKRGSRIRVPGTSTAAESAFLCLHLVGNEASSLFEVACRALFRLRPQQLPRFVERLARFRSFADGMRSAEDVAEVRRAVVQGSLAEDGPVPMADKPLESSNDEGVPDDSVLSVRGRGTAKGTEDAVVARSREGSPVPTVEVPESSPVQPTANPTSPTVFHKRRASDRSSSIDSLRTLDDADQGSGSGTRKLSGGKHHRARSADNIQSPVVTANSDDSKNANNADASPDADKKPTPASAEGRTTPATPPSYFTRALACLPPASADGPDGAQRRTRLVLLMGARRFSEAGKLLSVRAWEGASNSDSESGKLWRYDEESSAAWSAAIRLLGALRHAAEDDRDMAPVPSGASSAPGISTAAAPALAPDVHVSEPAPSSSPAFRATQLSVPSVNGTGNGSVALQYRVVFEDLLAQTILADEPDRMEMVMAHRPTELVPVAVIRMVRRAAAFAVDDDFECSPLKVNSYRADSASGGRTLPSLRSRGQPLASSARTLKRCLLLLVSTDAMGHGASSR